MNDEIVNDGKDKLELAYGELIKTKSDYLCVFQLISALKK